MRLSIKKHNAQYLQNLGEQMDIDDLSEVLNYLLLDVKGLGYKFGNSDLKQSQAITKSVSDSVYKPLGFDTFQPAFEPVLEQEIDPVIAHISRLIEDF
jgi:hypothetical protein